MSSTVSSDQGGAIFRMHIHIQRASGFLIIDRYVMLWDPCLLGYQKLLALAHVIHFRNKSDSTCRTPRSSRTETRDSLLLCPD